MEQNKTFRKDLLKQAGIALAVLIPLLIGVFYLKSYIRESVAQVIDIRQELAERSQTLNTLSILRSQYDNSAQANMNVLGNIIPSKDDLINISEEFESLARQQDLGFGFSFLSENVPEDSSDLGYIAFRLNITGDSVEEMEDFIESLENFRYLTTVDGVDIDRGQGEESVTLTLEGKVYYQNE